MPRDLILGTAGHIDHGKTTLVKALTGIDCDRLPEEKARGITIDIGFAYLDLGEYRLGIVDVPGHERFIKNMLAGATGIDLALLVVSAKESVKPQTQEHLEILKLLGLKQGIIALTMADLVDKETREVVALEVRELVQGTFLAEARIIFTSAITGEGIPELKDALKQACEKLYPESFSPSPLVGEGRGGGESPADTPTLTLPPQGGGKRPQGHPWFRLAIDRGFVVQGHGTVVTGSVTSGTLKVADEVAWHPSGQNVRVRGLQNHDTAVQEVHRGMRAAINLAGIKLEDIQRGQELATPGYLQPSRVLTARLYNLPALQKPLKHRASMRLHLGTAEVLGSVSLLDCDQLAPGTWGLAQLFLEEPVMAVFGQPFVIRSPSATATLGGGQILQPTPEKIRRRHFEILERVEKLWSTSSRQDRALEVAWFLHTKGLTRADLVRGAGLLPDEADQFIHDALADGRLKSMPSPQGKPNILHAHVVDEFHDRILKTLASLHEESPLMSTHDRGKVQAMVHYLGNDALVQSSIDDLLRQKKLIGDNKRIALAEHKPKLSANQRKLKEKMIETFREAGFQPPEIASFAPQAGGNAAALADITEVCVAEGYLVQVGEGLYLHAEHEARMRDKVRAKLKEGNGLTVAEIRDILATTRKFAVPLCEYLDRAGVTRREGDLRYLNEPTAALA